MNQETKELCEKAGITVSEQDKHLDVTIDRPKVLNALNFDVLAALEAVFADQDTATLPIAAVVLKGAGEKAFVAGADIDEMRNLPSHRVSQFADQGHRTMRVIEQFPRPVIACVDGFALGGGFELALACDIILASKKAKFGLPEINLGLIPGFGGTQRLLLRAGSGLVKRLIFTGEMISAEDALQHGIVDILVEPEETQQQAAALVEKLATKSRVALESAKRTINGHHKHTLLAGLRTEVEEFSRLFMSDDSKEGITAFLEKRPVKFTHK